MPTTIRRVVIWRVHRMAWCAATLTALAIRRPCEDFACPLRSAFADPGADAVEMRAARGVDTHARGRARRRRRRVERAARQAIDDEHILMRLKVRGNRPQHLGIIGDVDIAIHSHHILQIRIPAEQRKHDLARLAIARLCQGDVTMEVRAGVRILQCRHGRETGLQLLAHLCLARQTGERQMLGVRTADHNRRARRPGGAGIVSTRSTLFVERSDE